MTAAAGRSSLRRPLVLGIAVALGAGAVFTVAAFAEQRSLSIGSDGPHFEAVARHPFGDGSAIQVPAINGTAYRYGRILYPLLSWLMVGGQTQGIRLALGIVFSLSLGAAVALAAWLLQHRGRNPVGALVILATPFVLLWIRDPVFVADPTALALVFAVFVAFSCRRDGYGRGLAALAFLARETTVLAFLPLIWRDMRRGSTRARLGWAAAVLPYVAWMIWVRVRMDTWAFTDPAPSRRDALGLPVVSVVDAVGRTSDGRLALSVGIGVATVVLAIVGWRVRSWFPLAAGAALSAAIVPFLGSNVWPYPFELSRVLFVAQVLAALTWLGGDRRAVCSGGRGHVARFVLVVREDDLAAPPPLLDHDLPLVPEHQARLAAAPREDGHETGPASRGGNRPASTAASSCGCGSR